MKNLLRDIKKNRFFTRQSIARQIILIASLLALALPALAQWTPANPVASFAKQADGIVFTMKTGTLKLQVCTDSIIRVLYSATPSIPEAQDYVVIQKSWPSVPWSTESSDSSVTLKTASLTVVVARVDGSITYSGPDGKALLNEANRRLTPVKVNGEDTYRAESFLNIYGSPEGLYGLGQHQAGVWNYRGESVDISQDNSNIAVPMMVSSKGYFNNRFANYLYVSSEVADVIDYYFMYGPDLDKVVAAYRELTGQAPLFGNWAYGFWQC